MEQNNSVISTQPFGFIIVRCVQHEKARPLWSDCCRRIRKVYPSIPIVIVDDFSDPQLLTDATLENVRVIASEFRGSGEILGYYYLHKLRLFDKAVIMHDSMFLQRRLDLDSVRNVAFLWHFESHVCDDTANEVRMLKSLKSGDKLVELYWRKQNWFGCFGLCSVIALTFLDGLVEKHNFLSLVHLTNNRQTRMCLERIFALLCFAEQEVCLRDCSLLGCIHLHPLNWYLTYDLFQQIKLDLTIVKVWVGR